METRTAGDPDDPDTVFTDLTPTRLEQNLRLRKIIKVKAGGESPDRDTQFENIAQLIAQYQQCGNPYFSVDTKAKEFLGQVSQGADSL